MGMGSGTDGDRPVWAFGRVGRLEGGCNVMLHTVDLTTRKSYAIWAGDWWGCHTPSCILAAYPLVCLLRVSPAVGAEVLNTSRPGVEPARKTFTTSAQFEQSTPVGAVVVMSDNSYQKTDCNRWRYLQPGQSGRTRYLTTLDLIAIVLRSGRRDLVIVLPATTN